jgi:hypothetical protein
MKGIPKTLTEAELIAARKSFLLNEPRDLFYRVARELIRLAIAKQTEITLAEALGTLLQTWNKSFYRFHGKFDDHHIQALEKAITDHSSKLMGWRERDINSLRADERDAIVEVFAAFEAIVGPVGAAKGLHLLAPKFFPLWDRAIAAKYGVVLQKIGLNANNYLRFIDITKQQISELRGSLLERDEILKMIDEYNFCLYTKGWKLTVE